MRYAANLIGRLCVGAVLSSYADCVFECCAERKYAKSVFTRLLPEMCRAAIFASSTHPTLHTEALQVRLEVRLKYQPATSAHEMASALVQDVSLGSAATLSALILAVVQQSSCALSSACGFLRRLMDRRFRGCCSADIVPLRRLSFPRA